MAGHAGVCVLHVLHVPQDLMEISSHPLAHSSAALGHLLLEAAAITTGPCHSAFAWPSLAAR